MGVSLKTSEDKETVESALKQIEGHIHADYQISKRMIALMLLQDDQEI